MNMANMARLLCVNVVGALVVGAALAFQPSALQLRSRCVPKGLWPRMFSATWPASLKLSALRPLQTESIG